MENQLSFTQHNLLEKNGEEIVEVFTEKEDKAWRLIHKENVRKYKQGTSNEKKKHKEDITDEELWNRLEELELEEELENELLDNYNEIGDKRKDNLFLVNEEQVLLNSYREEQTKTKIDDKLPKNDKNTAMPEDKLNSLKDNVAETNETTKSKLDLLQQVLDKQNLLEDKLQELKNRDRQPSKTEKDLMLRLEEMEQLDELEDEMDRLDDDILETDVDSDDDEIIVKTTPTKLKKCISFADEVEDTSETIDVTFKHSNVEPSHAPYDPEKGISKPSDIYEAHSHHFNSKPTSILKKLKYDPDVGEDALTREKVKIDSTVDSPEIVYEYPVKETIVVKDVIENTIDNRSKIDVDVRPTSLFKKRRMQNKS